MKNRTILGIICIVLAIAIMFGVAPLVNVMTADKVEIVRFRRDVPQGTRITAEDVAVVEVGKTGLQDNAVKELKTVVGKYAACDIKAGSNVLSSYLTDTADSADDVFRALDGSKQAMSITIGSFADGLSGKLKNGDIVSILVTQEKKTVIPAELTYVKVITTTTAEGTDKDKLSQNEDGTYELPKTVTLLVNPTQATLLAGYEASGEMHLSLVYRGDEEIATQFLQAQEKVFQKEVKANE